VDGDPKLPSIPGYRMVRPIGAGGMGTVYEAEKLATHQTFAVKLMRGDFGEDDSHLLRFVREVKALREIRHPNVVDVYEWEVPKQGGGGRPYVVMEFLKGETLQDLLRRERLLPPRPAVAVMLQVLDGLAAAHGVGVVHRDLGPSNVFLVADPERKLDVKLLDFGLARPLLGDDAGVAVTQPGTMMGKPAYAAPESFDELGLGPVADILACGMIL
jgi:serine/threonine-protein kinase